MRRHPERRDVFARFDTQPVGRPVWVEPPEVGEVLLEVLALQPRRAVALDQEKGEAGGKSPFGDEQTLDDPAPKPGIGARLVALASIEPQASLAHIEERFSGFRDRDRGYPRVRQEEDAGIE
jgi:hypothetical protein